MIELNNKKILISGASGFIGRQIAITLSRLGASVILSGKNKEKLYETLSLMKEGNHHIIPFDVCEIEATKDFMKSIVEIDNQKLSGLVYSTGIFPLRPLKSVNYEHMQEIMLINFYGFIEMVKNFSDKRISLGGSIVALSSYASTNGDKGQLAYSATKGAIDSSIIVLAKELFSKNIRINSIRPAALINDGVDINSLPESIMESIDSMKTGPISPNNIAEQIAFLLSDCSTKITGNCFNVKGYLE